MKTQQKLINCFSMLALLATIFLLVTKKVEAEYFGRDLGNQTALIGADGQIMYDPFNLRGVPVGGEVINLNFTGVRQDVNLIGNYTNIQTAGGGLIIFNKAGVYNNRALRVVYDVGTAAQGGYLQYAIAQSMNARINGSLTVVPLHQTAALKQYYIRSVRVEYENGQSLPSNVYPLFPVVYAGGRMSGARDYVSLLYSQGITRLFSSQVDRKGQPYGSSLLVDNPIGSAMGYKRIYSQATGASNTIVAMLRGSNPASFGTEFPVNHANTWTNIEFNNTDANFIRLFPEDYDQIVIKDMPVQSTNYQRMTMKASYSQLLADNYFETFYPLVDSFKIKLDYDAVNLPLNQTDFAVSLSTGVQLANGVDYTIGIGKNSAGKQQVEVFIKRQVLVANKGATLVINQETANIAVNPSNNLLLSKYNTDGYKIDVTAQTFWDSPGINGSLQGTKSNLIATEKLNVMYKPVITGGDTTTYVAVNSRASDLDRNAIASDFASSYPGDTLSVTMDTPNMLFSSVGNYYNVPVTIRSSNFGVVKKQTIRVRVAEQTKFGYQAKRDDNTFKLQNFSEIADLRNRFGQMVIVMPDNIELLEPLKGNAEIDVPSQWQQPTDLTGPLNARSYTFPKPTTIASTEAIENYLARLTFNVMTDFDLKGEVKVIFKEIPLLTAFDENDPRNAVTKADIPQKIVISGKNTAGDELYNKTIANNLMIGVERAVEPETIQHYNTLPIANLAPRNIVTTHEFLYQAKEYQIKYEDGGGVGPVVPVQKYSVLDAQTALIDQKVFVRDNYDFDSWIDTVTGDTYLLGTILDKNDLPGNLTLVPNWELEKVDATIKYLRLDSSGKKTTKEVVEDLTTGKRQEAEKVEMIINTNISDGLPAAKEFAGYERVAQYDVFQDDLPYLSESVPGANFEIRYYYKPTMTVIVPKNLNFGTRPIRKTINTYGLVAGSELKDNSIGVINTYETINDEPSWELYASTYGFYRENTSDKLLAQLLFKHDGESQMISSSSTKIVKEQTTYTDDIPLINIEKDEGLFVRVANVQSVGKYNATLTIKLQRAP